MKYSLPSDKNTNTMRNNRGWTIIQTMIALLIAGLAGAVIVDVVIDKRCEADPSRPLCTDRQK